MMKTISIVPIKNTLLTFGDILRVMEQDGESVAIVKQVRNRLLGVLNNFNQDRYINIYNTAQSVMFDAGYRLINEATGKPRFGVNELEQYEKYIDKLEE